jgi:hypothetical protein
VSGEWKLTVRDGDCSCIFVTLYTHRLPAKRSGLELEVGIHFPRELQRTNQKLRGALGSTLRPWLKIFVYQEIRRWYAAL